MAIKFIRIKNFTVFDDLTITPSSGINIFIGQNGTGKTHFLKAIYGACEASKENKNVSVEFIRCFKQNASFFNFLHDKNNKKLCSDIFIDSENDIENDTRMCTVSLPKENDQTIWGGYAIHTPKNITLNATYIPNKDMLTHSKGLLAMREKYREFPFDKTLTDIISKANQWTVKETPPIAKSILPVLETIMNGEVYVENEEFFIKKDNGDLISFAVEAEGIKKIGLLWQLLMTDNITENSILLWDEPEANLNPEYLPVIVDCLLNLSRHNVQIFVSTHNYIFAKYFDVRRKADDRLQFHALYKENNAISCETADSFGALEHNQINRTFDHLLDEVYDMGTEE